MRNGISIGVLVASLALISPQSIKASSCVDIYAKSLIEVDIPKVEKWKRKGICVYENLPSGIQNLEDECVKWINKYLRKFSKYFIVPYEKNGVALYMLQNCLTN